MVVIFIVNSIYSKHKYKYEQFISMRITVIRVGLLNSNKKGQIVKRFALLT